MHNVWLFSCPFVHGRNLHVHERMSVLQCAYFLCIPTYLLYYLTPLPPPYLSRFTLLNSRMAPTVVTGARLLLATAGAIQNSVGQIFGDDQGEHPPALVYMRHLSPPPLKCSMQKPPSPPELFTMCVQVRPPGATQTDRHQPPQVICTLQPPPHPPHAAACTPSEPI